MLNNVASTQIEKIAIHDLDRKKINLISNIIQILQPIVIDYFSTHSHIVDISKYFVFVLDTMHLKRRLVCPPGVSTLDALNDSTWQRHLAEKIVV